MFLTVTIQSSRQTSLENGIFSTNILISLSWKASWLVYTTRCLNLIWSIWFCCTFYKVIIVKKKQEIGLVIIVRNHVLSAHCEAISWNLKLHATLLIICVYNITKYSFLYSISGQLYANQTSIFIMFHSNR